MISESSCPVSRSRPFVGEDALRVVNVLQVVQEGCRARDGRRFRMPRAPLRARNACVRGRRFGLGKFWVTLSAEMNAEPTRVMASVHQNHSRILANSEFIRPPRLRACGQTDSPRRGWS